MVVQDTQGRDGAAGLPGLLEGERLKVTKLGNASKVAARLDGEGERDGIPRSIVSGIQVVREAIIIAGKTVIDINLADYLVVSGHNLHNNCLT